MHAIVYDATGAVVGVVLDATIDGQRIKGSNMEMLTTAPYLLVEDDPGEIGNINELSGAERLAGVKAAKKQEIAAARYAAEIAGVAVGGVTVRTDRESQALITGAALKATQDGTYSCTWKAESGFVTLNAGTIIAVADAVRTHVQTCFDAEAAKCMLIDAAQTVEDIESVAW